MNHAENEPQWQVGTFIGWCIISASLAPLITTTILGWTLASRLQPVSFLLLALPVPLLMFISGLGLIMRKSFGYWCAYLAALVGGISGIKAPFVPFLQRYVHLGPETGIYFLILNLFMVAVLAWEHWGLLNEMEWDRRKSRRLGLLLVLLGAAASITFGATMESIKKGTASYTSQLPVINGYFKQLAVKALSEKGQMVHFVVVHNRIQHSVDAVISGGAEEEAIRAFAQYHSLRPTEKPEAFRKILSLTRRWKLGDRFPTDFAPPDLVFVGRPRDGSKAIIQIAWRKGDLRFTAEMMGSIISDDPPSESSPN